MTRQRASAARSPGSWRVALADLIEALSQRKSVKAGNFTQENALKIGRLRYKILALVRSLAFRVDKLNVLEHEPKLRIYSNDDTRPEY
jgi:hypothetical protein